MTDEHPLMVPPVLPVVPGLTKPPVAANLAAALALVGVAGLVLVLGVKSTWRITRNP